MSTEQNMKQLAISVLQLALLFAAGFAAVAYFVTARQIEQFDLAVIHYVQGLESPALTGVMTFFTAIGSILWLFPIVAAVSGYLYWILGHRKELILLLVAVAGSSIVNVGLKALFQRARPDIYTLIPIGGYSFPSGHSMTAFSFYGIVAFLIWKHVRTAAGRAAVIMISAFFILMVGISRVYLGVHYPSDIIGGYLAGAGWLCIAIWAYQWWAARSLSH